MATTHFKGPVSSTNGFLGSVTGSITGNVIGNLTGSVTGNVTGDVTGDLTGDVEAGVVDVNTLAMGDSLTRCVDATVTAAQFRGSFNVPVAVVGAPGIGSFAIPIEVVVYKSTGTAFASLVANQTLSLVYTNSPSTTLSGAIPLASFVDQTTAQIRFTAGPLDDSTLIPVENSGISIKLTDSDLTSGSGTLTVKVMYRIYSTT